MARKKLPLIPVETQPNLARDPISKAIINKNRSAYEEHVAKRRKASEASSRIKVLEDQVAELRALILALTPAK